MSEAWVAVSAAAGLVVAVVAVWQMVARAVRTLRDDIRTLRDEIRSEFRSEIGTLRENDLRRLQQGIEGLDSRIGRVEARLTESIVGVDKRLTAAIADVDTRLTAAIADVDKRSTAAIADVETRLTAAIAESEHRLTESFHRLEQRVDESIGWRTAPVRSSNG